MAQAQRSLRQIIARRHAIAARQKAASQVVASAAAPTEIVAEETYTILTPIKTWKSSRSRKRVVRRVKNPIHFHYGFVMPSLEDVAMLLDHNAYAVVGTIPARGAPVLGDGDLYVSSRTGEVISMGRTSRQDGGQATLVPLHLKADLALCPVATDLARTRSEAAAAAQQDANVIRGRFPR